MSVAEIGPELGVTRQSVHRIADILVEQGTACPTKGGREAVDRIRPGHAALRRSPGRRAGVRGTIADALVRLAAVLDELLSSDDNPGDA